MQIEALSSCKTRDTLYLLMGSTLEYGAWRGAVSQGTEFKTQQDHGSSG